MLYTPRILIAEDDELFRTMLVLMLQRVRPQFQLVEARHGHEAYTLYQQQRIDLIITDDEMPLMSGTALIRTLRTEHQVTPVVLLASSMDAKKAVQHDPRTVVAPKPVTVDHLLTIIDLLLAH